MTRVFCFVVESFELFVYYGCMFLTFARFAKVFSNYLGFFSPLPPFSFLLCSFTPSLSPFLIPSFSSFFPFLLKYFHFSLFRNQIYRTFHNSCSLFYIIKGDKNKKNMCLYLFIKALRDVGWTNLGEAWQEMGVMFFSVSFFYSILSF